MATGKVKIEVYLPKEALAAVRNALFAAGAGQLGNYDMCCSWWPVTGSWRPLPGANPYNGTQGVLQTAEEYKLELRCDAALAAAAVAAAAKAHPYEQPVINVVPLLEGTL